METTESPKDNQFDAVEEEQEHGDAHPEQAEQEDLDPGNSPDREEAKEEEEEPEGRNFNEFLPTVDNPYRVSLTMTIAVAYPKPSDEHSRILEELVRKNKKTIESPKPIYFLHCEYPITPQNTSTLTDVVTYAVAAKVFTDNDSRVVKTWDDGKKVWVAWMHTHDIDISMENVQSLHNHVIEIKLWDAKEKISSKARGDRPRAFRLPSETEIKFPGQGVHGVVSRLSDCWKSLQPKSSTTIDPLERPDSEATALDAPADGLDNATDQPEVASKVDEATKKSGNEVGKLAGIDPNDDEKKRMNELKRQRSGAKKKLEKIGSEATSKLRMNKASKNVLDKNTSKKEVGGSGKRKSSGSKLKSISVKLKLENLFAGSSSVAARIEERGDAIVDGFVTIATEKPLLPPAAVRALNPMSIKIRSVKHLPQTPIPQTTLAKTSKPVYCQYSFLDVPLHTTTGRPHGKHTYFEDNHVIFLGLMNEGLVREYILSNSFQIDVHDRDQKAEEETGDGNIFGVEKYDPQLSNVALVSAKRTSHNAFHSLKKGFDPFGVAKVSLLDILQGSTKINAEVAVNPCAIPEFVKDINSTTSDVNGLVGVPGAVDRPQRPPTLAGDYLQASTTLKLQITLACPFVPLMNAPRMSPLSSQICPFSRFVLFFDFSNKDLLRRVENFVTAQNARALGLDGFDKSVIDAALSTFKLTKEQKHSISLDIITGFHVIDGKIHLIVLEGIREEAMARLLEEVQFEKKNDDELLVYLYDTSMTYSSRLYAALDVDLCRVRLHQPLLEIMGQPLLYIRDMIPKECLECVVKLSEMIKMRRLRDVFRANLFPTAEMVICMSREFGIPLTHEDFYDPQTEVETIANDQEAVDMPGVEMIRIQEEPMSSRKLPPLDNTNLDFIDRLDKRKTRSDKVNYVTANIVAVQEAGKRHRPLKPSVRSLQVDGPPHNYSTQTLNSTDKAIGVMRDMLLENNPSARYTYNSEYNSLTFDPVDVDSYYRRKDMEARDSWRTREGFVYPGKRTSMNDNRHPLKPAESRISDLKLSFRDNILHRNVLEPNLDRERFSWEDRRKDVQLYSRPDFASTNKLPHSIMLAGDLKSEEENRFKMSDREEWRKKLVVDDTLMRFHRLLWETENSNRSNQIDRLTSLLKNRPIKYSLAKAPVVSIPPLGVVMNPSVDTDARSFGSKLPPAFDESREKNVGFKPGPYDTRQWTLESNRVPITDEQHQVFARKHGHDMNLYHKEKSLLSTRIPIKPLTDDETRTHLFRIPPIEQGTDESQDGTLETEREDEIYGEGPRGRSEYRVMYPAHEERSRIREVYPRHTFHGFAPLDKDGKPVTRDASVHLVLTEKDLSDDGIAEKETINRPKKSRMHEKEASIEVLSPPISPNATVPVA